MLPGGPVRKPPPARRLDPLTTATRTVAFRLPATERAALEDHLLELGHAQGSRGRAAWYRKALVAQMMRDLGL